MQLVSRATRIGGGIAAAAVSVLAATTIVSGVQRYLQPSPQQCLSGELKDAFASVYQELTTGPNIRTDGVDAQTRGQLIVRAEGTNDFKKAPLPKRTDAVALVATDAVTGLPQITVKASVGSSSATIGDGMSDEFPETVIGGDGVNGKQAISLAASVHEQVALAIRNCGLYNKAKPAGAAP